MNPNRRPIVVLAVGALLATAVSCGQSAGPADRGVRAGRSGASPSAGTAAPGHCTGAIGDRDVDEVRVPAGATCTLADTVVDGNISLAHGGTLRARGVDVDGDLEAEGARYVEVRAGSTIGGNIQVDTSGAIMVADSAVDGDLELEENRGTIVVQHTHVRGNLAADENRGRVSIARNDVGGDLTCEENDPAPTVTGNDVSGHQENQCTP